jgi:hypothetical protein
MLVQSENARFVVIAMLRLRVQMGCSPIRRQYDVVTIVRFGFSVESIFTLCCDQAHEQLSSGDKERVKSSVHAARPIANYVCVFPVPSVH